MPSCSCYGNGKKKIFSESGEILQGCSLPLDDCQIPSALVDPLKNRTASDGAFLPYMAIVQTSEIFFRSFLRDLKFYREVLRVTIRFLQLLLIYWKTWPPVGRAFLPYMAIVQSFYQIPSAISDPLKNMTKSEQGIFALHGYSAKFENLFQGLFKYFKEILQGCSLGDFLDLSDSFMLIHWKNMTSSGWSIFALYGYIANFKNLLLRIYSLDVNEIWALKFACAPSRLKSTWAFTQSDQSSLSTWRKLGSLATYWVHREDWSDWVHA